MKILMIALLYLLIQATTPADADPVLTVLVEQAQSFEGTYNADWQPIVYAFADDPTFAEMVLVPVGTFFMGSDSGIPNEAPIHEQRIESPFWLDRTEATRAQYTLCVEVESCKAPFQSETSTQPAQPINNLTWRQAVDYCAWRGLRLPTEKEWEFAARGVESWHYPWGNKFEANLTVWLANSNNQAAIVGSKPQGASWVGALDMSGNLWEWTSSLERYYPYSHETHEAETSRLHRVLRGGAFGTMITNNLRAVTRFTYLPNAAFDGGGVRCVRDGEN